jgi:hypothetical protein
MFDAVRRPIRNVDEVTIYWWRLVIFATRHLQHAKIRAAPVVTPLKPLLWVPLLALVLGIVIGWMIALA